MDLQIVQEWLGAKKALDIAKSRELHLRNAICNEVLQGKLKGVAHQIVDGYDVAATAKLNLSLDKELLDSIWNDLTPLEMESIRFKPELVAKQYNALDGSSKLHLAVTSKPGTPSLAIKPLKE